MSAARVTGYRSWPAALEAIERARRAADRRVRPWQAALAPGDRFYLVADDGLAVYGVVLEAYREPHLRGYRFCRCHSAACPEGELGDVHVATVARRISREVFDEARRRGWPALSEL